MFHKLLKELLAHFKNNSENLYFVEVDRDKIWEVYLNSFPEENGVRQSNNCNCCKSFLRQFGGIVTIKNNKMVSIWDFETDNPEYSGAIKALQNYIHSLPIKGVYYHGQQLVGTPESFDSKLNLVWNHFNLRLPLKAVKAPFSVATEIGDKIADKEVFQRALNEITIEATESILELIAQNSVYRGQEHKENLQKFLQLQKKYKDIPANERSNFCWASVLTERPAILRIRNTSIGTFLVDLSEGKELDKALGAFERMVAPANYKRPTAAITPKMIEKAQERLQELGLTGCLKRRILSKNNLNVNNSVWVHRATAQSDDIFTELKKDVAVNPKTFSKVEEVSIQDFVEKVLPTAKKVKALIENSHFGNFVSLVGPQEESEKTLFKWNNNFSWSYAGEVADSIKERVKSAGGKVDGILRISLSWSNYDDLDLHVIEPKGNEICFYNKNGACSGVLDVDMNAGYGKSRNPVENVCYSNYPKHDGLYKVVVHNYCKREDKEKGFELEIEYDGEVYSFSNDTNGCSGKRFDVVSFDYSRENGVKIQGGSSTSKSYNSREKWGVKTGVFHSVSAVSLSPNYWGKEIGNKHFFFFLEDCKADEKIRGFYNEFLKEELSADRKVFETLGNKVVVEPSANELSGLGFSETMRNHLIVEVEGATKRVIKIKF